MKLQCQGISKRRQSPPSFAPSASKDELRGRLDFRQQARPRNWTVKISWQHQLRLQGGEIKPLCVLLFSGCVKLGI